MPEQSLTRKLQTGVRLSFGSQNDLSILPAADRETDTPKYWLHIDDRCILHPTIGFHILGRNFIGMHFDGVRILHNKPPDRLLKARKRGRLSGTMTENFRPMALPTDMG